MFVFPLAANNGLRCSYNYNYEANIVSIYWETIKVSLEIYKYFDSYILQWSKELQLKRYTV